MWTLPHPTSLFGATSPVLGVCFLFPDYSYVILTWNIWNFLLTVLTLGWYICHPRIFLMDGSPSNMSYHLYFTSAGLRTTLPEVDTLTPAWFELPLCHGDLCPFTPSLWLFASKECHSKQQILHPGFLVFALKWSVSFNWRIDTIYF